MFGPPCMSVLLHKPVPAQRLTLRIRRSTVGCEWYLAAPTTGICPKEDGVMWAIPKPSTLAHCLWNRDITPWLH